MDICLNFLRMQYAIDGSQIRSHATLAKLQFTGWNLLKFTIEVLAAFPFYLIESVSSLVSIKLLRMTKLTRVAMLLDVNRFKKIAALLTSHYNRNDKIRAQLAVKNIYKVFRLIIMTIFITYFTGVLYVYFLLSNFQTFDIYLSGQYFINQYNLEPPSFEVWDYEHERTITIERGSLTESQSLVAVMYFALTTLTTVGYGDMFPISNVDKICILLL